MTADEMFEKLGWEKNYEDEDIVEYLNEERELDIDKKRKQFICRNWQIVSYDYDAEYITCDELKAINQKCKELGWIE